jgi:LytS/YehU family sensor histidine kinase
MPRCRGDLGVTLVLSFNGVTVTDIGIYWGIVGVLALKSFAQREDALELRSAHLQAALARAELRALKYQLKPHFVFNSLNAVAALIREERYGKAIDTLADLSMMMRTLSDAPAHERIPLQQEIEFIRHLLAIEQVRFGDKLQVRIEVEPSVAQALVPNLVLQPLVENAIKHGISKRVRPGRVTVLAGATPDRQWLRLQVLNDGPSAVRTPEGTAFPGVGLSATHSRLQHLYGDRFSLRLDLEREEDAFVEVLLPLEFPPAP